MNTLSYEFKIDPNVRVSGNLTYVGFEDLQNQDLSITSLSPGVIVKVIELETRFGGIGEVVRIDYNTKLIHLNVRWQDLKYIPRNNLDELKDDINQFLHDINCPGGGSYIFCSTICHHHTSRIM